MLKEMPIGQQGDRTGRRWFADENFELIVWLTEQGKPKGFQLCYDRKGYERALTWTEDAGFMHDRVDDGEASPTKNQSPVLVSDTVFAVADTLQGFEMASAGVEAPIRKFVVQKLREYAGNADRA